MYTMLERLHGHGMGYRPAHLDLVFQATATSIHVWRTPFCSEFPTFRSMQRTQCTEIDTASILFAALT